MPEIHFISLLSAAWRAVEKCFLNCRSCTGNFSQRFVLKGDGHGLSRRIPRNLGVEGLRHPGHRQTGAAIGDLGSDIHGDRLAVDEHGRAADSNLDRVLAIIDGDLLRCGIPRDAGVGDANGIGDVPQRQERPAVLNVWSGVDGHRVAFQSVAGLTNLEDSGTGSSASSTRGCQSSSRQVHLVILVKKFSTACLAPEAEGVKITPRVAFCPLANVWPLQLS